MKKAEDLEWRMYGLVPYNISPIQQGIQFGHGVVEYELILGDSRPYRKWSEKDKTFIILNGGTTNSATLSEPIIRENESNTFYKGSLNNHLESLRYNKIPHSSFYEPDLGDQLTSVNFLVDERVFDKKKYPDFEEYLVSIPIDDKVVSIDTHFDNYWKAKWVEMIGGEKNVWLREFLSQFRLA